MFNKKKKKTRITDKIKSYMSTVSVDVFNYEEIVIDNITGYFEEVARLNGVSKHDIHVRIHKREELRAFVYHKSSPMKRVTTVELINFFMGEGSATLFDLEQKVEQNVSNYLSDYAAITGIEVSKLTIIISKPAQEVMVGAYLNKRFIETIPLKGLVKYFAAGNA